MSAARFTIGGARADAPRRSNVSVSQLVIDHHCKVSGQTISAMYQVAERMHDQGIDTDEILDTLEHMLPVVS
jgi:F420-0:gamma-glutamyl ligase-like protein